MKLLKNFLGTILALVAVNAFGGGYYGLSGAKDIPLEWLKDSPFRSYFIPALFLFVVVGGSCLYASIAVFRNRKSGRTTSLLCGILMISWIMIQVSIIGYVSWMQPAIFITGIVVLLAAWNLRISKKA
jgi:hypothetical protein